MEEYLISFQPDLEVVKLISSLLEEMDIETLSDRCEIDSDRLVKILSLEGNPTLGEIKRLSFVAGKNLRLEFV